MNEQKRKQQGITLIALVVTIVVLLILAAVSIGMLTGENGIITQAQKSREETIIADEKEILGLSYSACQQKNMFESIVTEEQLQIELDNNKRNTTVTQDGEDLEVIFNDTNHKYIIYQDGTIEQVENLNPEEANKIVDVVVSDGRGILYVLTAEGKVKQVNIIKGNIFHTLEIKENAETITRNGVRKKGNGWFIDNQGKVYIWGMDSDELICINEIAGSALNGKNIIDVFFDGYTVIALDNQGKVYTWGDNRVGQLGIGTDIEYSNEPICISEIGGNALNGKNIIDVFADEHYGYTVIALDNQGKVYTWGDNRGGQLGIGTDIEYSNEPICISEIGGSALNGKNIIDVFLNEYTVIALDDQGKVYTWGANGDSNKPICISDIGGSALNGKNIIDVFADGDTVIALDNQGKIYTWGYNGWGQLGNGTDIEYSNEPICISDIGGSALNGKNIIDVFFDGYTVIALDNQGKVYTWGDNRVGQLGIGTDIEYSNEPICISEIGGNALNGKNIIHIYFDVKDATAIALDDQGKVYTWGNNQHRTLGVGTDIEYSNEPICISDIPNSEIKEIKIKTYGNISNQLYYYISEDNNIYVLPYIYT